MEILKRYLNNFINFIKKYKIQSLCVGLVIILIIVIILVTMLLRGRGLISITRNPDGEKFKEEYESLNDDTSEEGKTYPKVEIPANNIMKYTDTKEVLSIFKDRGNAVIYFGYPECLYCRSAIGVLLDVAATTKLDVIYYLDVKEEDSLYNELLNTLGKEFTVDNKIYVPLVVFVVDGTIQSYNKGTLFSQDDPYVEMDASQIKGLSEIYYYGINDVLGNPQPGSES